MQNSTFTPAVDLSKLPGHSSPTDDLERDHVLSQRILLFSWIQPRHLDLPLPSDPTSIEERSVKETGVDEISVEKEMETGPADEDELDTQAGDDGEDGPIPESEDDVTLKNKERHQAQGFVDFARRELNKINQYKAPRDKLICILNCCKVIFGECFYSWRVHHSDTDIQYESEQVSCDMRLAMKELMRSFRY